MKIVQQRKAQNLDEAAIRCTWSIFMLERTFCSRLPYSIQPIAFPPVPHSPRYPRPPSQDPISGLTSISQGPAISSSDERSGSGFATPDQVVEQFGINVACAKAVDVWGDIVAHLYTLRAGQVDPPPWRADSAYNRINAKIIECDVFLSNDHLLRHVHLAKRTLIDIEQDRGYWSTWLLTQICTHGSQAVLNHPFIHLIVLRDQKGNLQSRNFHQHTVDQALFHSGWVARLLRTTECIGFETHDPLLANIVAAVATVPWIFQFARDRKVAERAKEDVAICERLLSRLAKSWPQAADKLRTLRRLKSLDQNQQTYDAYGHAITTFKPALVWELLDSDISWSFAGNVAGDETSAEAAETPSAVMRVATKFVHPLLDTQGEQLRDEDDGYDLNKVQDNNVISGLTPTNSHGSSMLDFYLQLDPDDFQWMDPQINTDIP